MNKKARSQKKMNANEMKQVKGGISNEPTYRPLSKSLVGISNEPTYNPIGISPVPTPNINKISISPVPTPN